MKKLFIGLFLISISNIVSAQNWLYENSLTPGGYTSPIHFGYSIDLDSNYTYVGAPGYNNNTGAVFILDNNTQFWDLVGILTASDGEADDQFGISVSVDNNVLVVGSMGDDDNGTDAGALYVFEKPGIGWNNMTETAKLLASDGEASDILGKSVSIYQDVIIAGAHLDDDNGTDAGAAYIFTKPVSGWVNGIETAKLLASDGASNDSFGHSVSIHGNTVVVGAMWDDVNGLYSGSAYVFDKPVTGWTNMTETAKLLPVTGAGYNYFGNFVDIYEDDIIIGSGANKGYVFTKPVTGWVNMNETAILTASDGPVDWFANAVSINENTIVLGAERDDEISTDAGAIYIYEKPLGGWVASTENQKILNYYTDQDDYFGHAVSVFNNSIAVGAYNKDVLFGFTVGAAVLYQNCNSYTYTDTSVCDTYTSPIGNVYTSSTTIVETIPNASGCDSVMTINLTVNHSNTGVDVISACDSYTWIDGNTYSNDNNTATYTLTNQNGCDSVVTLNLTINQSNTGVDVISACNSYTWIDGNTYFNDNNTATYTLTNQNGCDSIVTLNLTITTTDVSVTQYSINLTANSNVGSYQWLDCDDNMSQLVGETNQSFTAITNGDYAVEITNNGCVDTSQCMAITEVSLLEFDADDIIIAPNPTLDYIYIKTNQIINNIEIYSVNGKLLFSDSNSNNIIDLSLFPKGIYTLRIMTNDHQIIYRKIVKE